MSSETEAAISPELAAEPLDGTQASFQTASTAPINLPVEFGKTYWWCACGLSKKQPFCDGSHKITGLSPLRYRPAETGVKSFCVCKRTKNPPFCDGVSHPCAVATDASS
jgi:CDGSH-type Zn-finger protein